MMKPVFRFAGTLLLVLIGVLVYSGAAMMQTEDPAQKPAGAPTEAAKKGFPASLYCADVPVGPGPAWNNITIGISHEKELLALAESDTDYFEDGTRSIMLGGYRYVSYCTDENDVITVMWVYVEVDEPADFIYLQDLVAELGTPDVVSYEADTQYSRLAFWFEKGIAASVFVGGEGTDFFGYIPAITYFPYQDAGKYASGYPYAYTCGPEYCLLSDEGGAPEGLAPFDFDAMLLTATHEPSRTPTPTFTPMPSATATPEQSGG